MKKNSKNAIKATVFTINGSLEIRSLFLSVINNPSAITKEKTSPIDSRRLKVPRPASILMVEKTSFVNIEVIIPKALLIFSALKNIQPKHTR